MTSSVDYAPAPVSSVARGKNPLTGWFHANAYGFSTANADTVNDAALAAALADMSNADTLYIPPATAPYLFTSLAPAKAIRILGGWSHIRYQTAFGVAGWTNGTAVANGLITGTVLQSTVTSGIAISFISDGTLSGSGLENVVLIGAGSGTPTGLQLGASGGSFPVRTRLRNVVIGNYATGVSASCENSTWDGLYIVGCNTGLATTWTFNGNTINGLNIEITTVAALSMTSSDGNVFNGGVIQGNTGDGIVMAGCWGNELYFYIQNSAAVGPQNDLHLTSDPGTGLGSCDNKIGAFWATPSGSGPRFLIDGAVLCRRNTIHGSGPHGSVTYAVVNGGVNNNFLIYLVGTVTDTGRNNAYVDDGVYTGMYMPIFTTAASGGSLQVNDNIWVLTGSAQTVSLPDPTTMRAGRMLVVKNATTNVNNVVNSLGTSKTIDGAASVTLTAWQVLRVISNGSQWLTV